MRQQPHGVESQPTVLATSGRGAGVHRGLTRRPATSLQLQAFGPIVALIAFGLICLYPELAARFVLVDDHEILNMLPPLGAPVGASPHLDLREMAFVADPSVGRFRPLYWAIRLTEVAVLADHPGAWHALMLGYGLTAACLLYGAARGLGADRLASALFGGWLLVAPGVSSLWVRLGADDTRATVFLTLALFAAARARAAAQHGRPSVNWDVLLVLAACAAALTKESFALASIAVAFFRTWGLTALDRDWRSRRPPVASLLVALLALTEVAVALRVGASAGQFSHGGRYLALPDLRSYLATIAHNAAILGFAGMAWMLAFLLFLQPGRQWRAWIVASIPGLVLVIPQLLLYSQQGVFEGKYEAAAAIGVAAASTATLVWLTSSKRVRLHWIGLGVYATGLLAFGFSTWTYARYFAEDSIQLNRMVQAVATSTPMGQTIAVAADPGTQYEPIASLVDHIRHQGRTDVALRLLPLPPQHTYSALEASLAADLAANPIGQTPVATCQTLGAVIVLGDEAATRAALPCLNQGFRRVSYTGQVLLWGGDAVSLRPRVPGPSDVGYVLLLSNEAT